MEVIMKRMKMEVVRKTVSVNDATEVRYVYEGEEHKCLSDILRKEFNQHGDFYEKVLGVSFADAKLAGWHPDHYDFCDDCDGWRKMIQDQGKVTKTEKNEVVNVLDILFPPVPNEDE